MIDTKKIKLVTFVSAANADGVREALGQAGAGTIGEYMFCSFSVVGTGRFTPSKDARPHIGQPNQAQTVEEERIEVVCNRGDAKAIIQSLKQAHPYEEVALDLYPLLEESDL